MWSRLVFFHIGFLHLYVFKQSPLKLLSQTAPKTLSFCFYFIVITKALFLFVCRCWNGQECYGILRNTMNKQRCFIVLNEEADISEKLTLTSLLLLQIPNQWLLFVFFLSFFLQALWSFCQQPAGFYRKTANIASQTPQTFSIWRLHLKPNGVPEAQIMILFYFKKVLKIKLSIYIYFMAI